MYDIYHKMIANTLTEDDLFAAFDAKIKQNLPKASSFLNKLKLCKDHWLPSCVNKIQHRGIVNTNRVEGFFGVLKRLIEHRSQYLSHLFQLLLNNGDKLLNDSIKLQNIPLDPTIISVEDAKLIGTFAAAEIQKESLELYDFMLPKL